MLATSAGVWFESTADNLVDGDNNAASDIFYRSSAGVVQKFTLAGIAALSTSAHLLSASADGSYAAVLIDAPEVLGASAGTPQVPQLLLWQRATQKWNVISQAALGFADQDVLSGMLAPNGQCVAFTTSASNLASGEPVAMYGQLFVAPVKEAFNKSPTGSVTITGTATQGQTLTVSNTLIDADGMGVIGYQWLADGTAISGATGTTLLLSQPHVGKQISVKASYIDLGLTAESVTSPQTTAVANVNDAPAATSLSLTTNEDTVKTGSLAGTDVDGNTLSFAKVTDPGHGAVVINVQTGAYTYTPAANFNGSDSFSFKVNDGVVDSAAATVSITVNAINDAPAATSLSLTTNEDTVKTGSLAGTDVDGNTLSFAKVTDPGHGTVVVNAQTGAYTYTPAANFNGSDSFTFKVNDGTLDSATATVSINVVPVNDAPTGSVTITGLAGLDRTLTASNTLADADGLGTVGYQWLADGTAIGGATSASLVLAPAQLGKKISVTASYTDGHGTAESVTSAQMSTAVVQTYDFGGQVYEWKTHALVSGVTLTADGSTVQSNASGHYDLADLFHNQVDVSASKSVLSSEAQLAITSADVTAALQMAAGRNPNANGALVTPYQFMAADINGDGKVTSGDALAILKMVQGASDAPAREWLFVQETQDFWNEATRAFSTTRNDVAWGKAMQWDAPGTHNLVAVLKGDVNGSWSAPAGALDLDNINASYFKDLANQLRTSSTQWGVLSV